VTACQIDEPIVFVFQPTSVEALLKLESEGKLTSDPLPYYAPLGTSGLFVLGNRTGAQGWRRTFSSMNPIHAFLCAHKELAFCPTLVSSGKSKVAHYYPQGLDQTTRDNFFDLGIGGVSVLTVARLKQQLEFFATDKMLNKATNRGDIWGNSGKYWPNERAEKNIQRLLVMALQMSFQEGLVLEELPVPSGRTDVVIEQHTPPSFVRFLLELKAVRKFTFSGGSPGDQFQHCTDGVIQALTNGKDLEVNNAFLCAYDLRPAPDATLKTKVEQAAAPYDVEVCWYPLHSTSKLGRKARAAGHIVKGVRPK
jgi:hypothetical protein